MPILIHDRKRSVQIARLRQNSGSPLSLRGRKHRPNHKTWHIQPRKSLVRPKRPFCIPPLGVKLLSRRRVHAIEPISTQLGYLRSTAVRKALLEAANNARRHQPSNHAKLAVDCRFSPATTLKTHTANFDECQIDESTCQTKSGTRPDTHRRP